MNEDIKYMKTALREAEKAYEKNEVPIGAVIVKDGKIIAKGYNEKESRKDVTKHAEITAIRKASQKLDNWRLTDCKIYVTLKPCDMCQSAIIQSRISEVIIGTDYIESGARESHTTTSTFPKEVKVKNNIMETECKEILQRFFKEKRKNK